MFAIRTNQPPMSKRRRRAKVVIYTLIIIVLAIGIPIVINSIMDSDKQSRPADLNNDVLSKINELESSLNEQKNVDQPAIKSEAQIQEGSDMEPETPVAEQVAAPEPQIDGSVVTAPAGYQITIPTKWYYSFINEGDYQSLNFGSQLFGPDNPYNIDMPNDFYGYVVPVTAIPTEAIGALATAESIDTNSQKTVEKSTYLSNSAAGDEMTQAIYKFKVNDTDFGLVFYAASGNTDVINLIDPIVKTLVLP